MTGSLLWTCLMMMMVTTTLFPELGSTEPLHHWTDLRQIRPPTHRTPSTWNETTRALFHAQLPRRIQTQHLNGDHMDRVGFSLDAPATLQHVGSHLHFQVQIINVGGREGHVQERHQVEHCYYHGHIEGVPNSFVALSTCRQQVEGVFHLDGRHFDIQPRQKAAHLMKRHTSPLANHVIIEHVRPPQGFRDEHRCESTNNDNDLSRSSLFQFHPFFGTSIPSHLAIPFNTNDSSTRVNVNLRKRATPSAAPLYMEVLIANDRARVDAFGSDLESNTLQLANIAAGKYQQLTSGFPQPLYLVVAGVFNAPSTLFRPTETGGTVDADAVLKEFAQWRQQQLQQRAESGLGANDVAHLLTGRDMTTVNATDRTVSTSINGLSNVQSICDEARAASVSEARAGGMTALQAITFAHELGHVLSLPHDGVDGTAASSCPPRGHVMQAVGCSNCAEDASMGFSRCSESLLRSFLQQQVAAGSARCLQNEPVRRWMCGNGQVDREQMEQCDSGSASGADEGCCHPRTCQWLPAQTACSVVQADGKRLAGWCGAEGECQVTCGNGKLEAHEDCDPSANPGMDSSGGGAVMQCCDPRTCLFTTDTSVTCSATPNPLTPSSATAQGQCDGDGRCAVGVQGTLPRLQVTWETSDDGKVVVKIQPPTQDTVPSMDQWKVWWTLDGTLPRPSSVSSQSLSAQSLSSAQSEIILRFDRETAVQLQRSSPRYRPPRPSSLQPNAQNMPPAEGGVRLALKAYHPDYLASPLVQEYLQFPPPTAGSQWRAIVVFLILLGMAFVWPLGWMVAYGTSDAIGRQRLKRPWHHLKLKIKEVWSRSKLVLPTRLKDIGSGGKETTAETTTTKENHHLRVCRSSSLHVESQTQRVSRSSSPEQTRPYHPMEAVEEKEKEKEEETEETGDVGEWSSPLGLAQWMDHLFDKELFSPADEEDDHPPTQKEEEDMDETEVVVVVLDDDPEGFMTEELHLVEDLALVVEEEDPYASSETVETSEPLEQLEPTRTTWIPNTLSSGGEWVMNLPPTTTSMSGQRARRRSTLTKNENNEKGIHSKVLDFHFEF